MYGEQYLYYSQLGANNCILISNETIVVRTLCLPAVITTHHLHQQQ